MKLRDYPTDELYMVRLAGKGRVLLKRGALLAAMAAPLAACDGDTQPTVQTAGPQAPSGEAGKADWAQYEGQRDVDMVRYEGSYWHELSNCNTRGGCMTVGAFVKVRVKRVEGADLSKKQVGLVVRNSQGHESTAVGKYFSTHADGTEEWHVPVYQHSYAAPYFTFNAWYQDGAGHTFYDDNDGELHAIAYRGDSVIIRHAWDRTDVAIDDTGVKGKIGLWLADLDYDKDVEIVYTTDGWLTSGTLKMAAPGTQNAVYWVEDAWAGFERWEASIDLRGEGIERFEYAVRYRHGVIGNARHYDFWDNNGGRNHVVTR